MSTASFQEGAWRTSSYSNGGANDCVEVNHSLVGQVGVRYSKLGTTSSAPPARCWPLPAAQCACLLTAIQHGTLPL